MIRINFVLAIIMIPLLTHYESVWLSICYAFSAISLHIVLVYIQDDQKTREVEEDETFKLN